MRTNMNKQATKQRIAEISSNLDFLRKINPAIERRRPARDIPAAVMMDETDNSMTEDRYYLSPEHREWVENLDRDLRRLHYLDNLKLQGKLDPLLELELQCLSDRWFPPPKSPAPPPLEKSPWFR